MSDLDEKIADQSTQRGDLLECPRDHVIEAFFIDYLRYKRREWMAKTRKGKHSWMGDYYESVLEGAGSRNGLYLHTLAGFKRQLKERGVVVPRSIPKRQRLKTPLSSLAGFASFLACFPSPEQLLDALPNDDEVEAGIPAEAKDEYGQDAVSWRRLRLAGRPAIALFRFSGGTCPTANVLIQTDSVAVTGSRRAAWDEVWSAFADELGPSVSAKVRWNGKLAFAEARWVYRRCDAYACMEVGEAANLTVSLTPKGLPPLAEEWFAELDRDIRTP
jgi:hypothetical protein